LPSLHPNAECGQPELGLGKIRPQREDSHMTDPTQHGASFETDVRPLFRESDRDAMLKMFDLWSYADVRGHAQQIAEQLRAGTMPCDGAWPADDVMTFTNWMSNGAKP
jgi:hypothetical protein